MKKAFSKLFSFRKKKGKEHAAAKSKKKGVQETKEKKGGQVKPTHSTDSGSEGVTGPPTTTSYTSLSTSPSSTSSTLSQLTLTQLPPEILLQIISCLPFDQSLLSLKSSCNLFKQLVEEPILWNQKELVLRGNVSWPLIDRVLMSSPALYSLDFTKCTGVTDHLLATVVTVHPGISHINITGCVLVTDFGLVKIEQGLRAVKSLIIAGCNMITCGGVFRVVRKHEKTIEVLNFNDCYGLSFDPFRMSRIADFCGNLLSLSVGWPVHTVGMNPVLDRDIAKFAASCPNLTSLDVSNGRMSELGVEAVAVKCRKLIKLRLCHTCIRNSGVLVLSKYLHHLQHLDLTDCSYVQDRGVASISENLTQLRYLNLARCFNVTDRGVVDIISMLGELRELILNSCFRITDLCIMWSSAKLDNLCYLDLSTTLISDVTVDHLRKYCNKTLRLKTYNCPFVVYSHLLEEVSSHHSEWPPRAVRCPRPDLVVI